MLGCERGFPSFLQEVARMNSKSKRRVVGLIDRKVLKVDMARGQAAS